MVFRQLLFLIVTVNRLMLMSCQGCDPSALGQKGHYEFCKTSNSSNGIGYKHWGHVAVFCFSGKHAFAGDEAFAHCPSGYEIKGALKIVCQTYGFWIQQPVQELWPICKLKVNSNFEATPSRPVITMMYVIGILAYVSGYVLMGLSECHREHIFGRRFTTACLTCLPCLGLLTIAPLILWFFTKSFAGDDESSRTELHCLYAAFATSLVYVVCSILYFVLVCYEKRRKLSASSSREYTTDDPYIPDTSNSMSLEFKNKTPLLNSSPETQCEPSAPPPQYDTLAHHKPRRQLEESAPPSYERVVNLRY